MNGAILAVGLIVQLALLARHLTVAQLEHYGAGSVVRSVARWYSVLPWNDVAFVASMLLAAAGTLGGSGDDWPGLAGVLGIVGLLGLGALPLPLGLRGVEWRATYTRRMRVLGLVGLLITAVVNVGVLLGFGLSPLAMWLPAALSPLLVDLALLLLRPLDERTAHRYAKAAADALRRVGPRVVAITGSYGKTTTKQYLASLLSGVTSTVASPASFNNRAGLSRAVSERLEPGTEVFVAEMGTYGPGEIAELCRYFPPDVSVITAIGPVHLERMRTIEQIVTAKSEILREGAPAVLNVDHPELAALADRWTGSRVIRVATAGPDGAPQRADVVVRPIAGGFEITADGTVHRAEHPAPDTLDAGNLACAVGAILALGLDLPAALRNVGRIERPANRRTSATVAGGYTVLDDTFNSNPAGARRAVADLTRLGGAGRKVLVTPGMVELGPRQGRENEDWIADSGAHVDELIVVGHTNRSALRRGAKSAGLVVRYVARRADATVVLRSELRPGDAVLYENDLPVHYP